jgi:hypothetical protein
MVDQLDKTQNKEIKSLHKEVAKLAAEKAKLATRAIKSEYKKQTTTAIISAFALIIALAWKDVIQAFVAKIISNFSLQGATHIVQLYTALITTIVCVIGILSLNRWSQK